MLELNGVLFGTLLFVAASLSPMLRRTGRIQMRQLRSLLTNNAGLSTSSSTAAQAGPIPESKCTLIDFKLPAKENEVIQNLVNDEIISNLIIGNK